MSDTIDVNRSEALNVTMTWRDEDGNPIDISGATITVLEPRPAALADLIIAKTGNPGEFTVKSTIETADELGLGRTNSFRLNALFAPESNDTTPRIWINVV